MPSRFSLKVELRQSRDFALRGNLIDLAFAAIIGAAFGKIVDSLVKDIIMPIIGMVGSADFSNDFLPLSEAETATNLADAQKQGAVLAWGSFLTYVVIVIIVAAALFLTFRFVKALQKRMVADPPAGLAKFTPREVLLAEIRDSLAREPLAP